MRTALITSLIGVIVAVVPMSAQAESTTVIPRTEETPCTGSPDIDTYTLCAALWSQPGYDVEQPDGGVLTRPTGSELIALIAEEGITPGETPEEFRSEASIEINGFFSAIR